MIMALILTYLYNPKIKENLSLIVAMALMISIEHATTPIIACTRYYSLL